MLPNPGSGGVVAAVLALLVGLLVSGCGGARPAAADAHRDPSPHSRPAVPSATAPRSPTASVNAQGNGVAVPPLPDLSTGSGTGGTRSAGPSGPLRGADAGWPQCPRGMGIRYKPTQGSPMPLATARFVILGVTNGPSFSPNPCLADQVRWVRERRLLVGAYAVVSMPDARALSSLGSHGPFDTGTRHGRLANTGYQAARYDLDTMQRAGLRVPGVWIDVESVPHYDWGGDTAANAAVVGGAVRGFRDAGMAVGVYSTPALWRRVVGGLRLGLPEWRAAGQTSRAEALRRCAGDWSFQGGTAVVTQWVEDGRDQDVSCPGRAARLRAWLSPTRPNPR